MNRIDHGVHSLLPLWAGAQERLSVASAGWIALLAIITIWAVPPIKTRAAQPNLERKEGFMVEFGG
jgi:hypothetical protein